MHPSGQRPPSQRQLKVGEELRHALSQIFMQRNFIYDHPTLASVVAITVSEVRISPDLKNAMAFVTPLGGNPPKGFESSLNELAPKFRYALNKLVTLKFSPKITFRLDASYDHAHRIHSLLEQARSSERSSEDADQSDQR